MSPKTELVHGICVEKYIIYLKEGIFESPNK